MWFHQQLRRGLSKVPYLILDGLPHHFIVYRLQFYVALVGQVVENIGGSHSFRSPLLVTEDQVDPLVQLTRHEFAFQRHTIDPDEFLRRTGPRRQFDVAYRFTVLVGAQTVAVRIDEHLRQEEELRDQLFDVGGVSLAVFPRVCDRSEHPVRVVEFAAL